MRDKRGKHIPHSSWDEEEIMQILTWLKTGATYEQIGKYTSVSKQRINQLISETPVLQRHNELGNLHKNNNSSKITFSLSPEDHFKLKSIADECYHGHRLVALRALIRERYYELTS